MKAAARVERLQALMGEQGLDAIVVRSTTDLQWLTGFEGVFDTEQAHTAVVTADSCVIHTDSRYSTAMRTAAAAEGLWQVDDERVRAAGFVHSVLSARNLLTGTVAIDADTPLSLYRSLAAALGDVHFAEREGDILALRSVKEPAEVELMRKAQAIASEAFLATLETVQPGQTEAEVSLKLEFAMRERGASELAFANIVASGPNSANPHAIPGQRKLQRGDLVVFDFGARYEGYRSDTTRTICIGQPSQQQRAIYDAVKLANETCRNAIMPGMTGKEMHELAEAILAEAGFGGRMGHGLGHGVGLDIHEQPTLSPRNADPLPEGAIVTIEPGIYLSGEDGVRIEDCGQLTADGFVNFCDLSHELVVVE